LDNCEKFNISELRDELGSTLLHYAAFARSQACIDVLTEKKCDASVKDATGNTADDIASTFSCISVVQLFSQCTATIDIRKIAMRQTPISEIVSAEPKSFTRDQFRELVQCMSEKEEFEDLCDFILKSPALGPHHHQTLEMRDEISTLVDDMKQFVSALINSVDFGQPVGVMLRGSMAEGTRSGPPDEFDFLLITESYLERKHISERITQLFSTFKPAPIDYVNCYARRPRVLLQVLYCGRNYKHLPIFVDLVPHRINFIGNFFLAMDQGKYIRKFEEQKKLLSEHLDLKVAYKFRSGINIHSLFVGVKKE
jgi:hypothetical protein